MNKTYLFITISSISLSVVLIIQINWIFQTAKIKEELFNDKANIVLSRTTEALTADNETCARIGACVKVDKSPGFATKLEKDIARKIDSMFTYYMKFYNFHLDYSFVITKPKPPASNSVNRSRNYIYNKKLEKFSYENPIQLELTFPDKRQFIIAEMGSMFITSVLLILIVLVMFWRTTLSLLKEKKISEQTTDFLNNMTHEFKTPLTNIALASKMILKNATNNQEKKIKHYAEILLEENEKLSLQIEQVLGMTALERGELPLRKVAVDFHHLITNYLKCIRIHIEDKQGDLTIDLNAKNAVIIADKIHITNAFRNLIDNAIKYSNEKIILSIQTANIGQNMLIIVSDKGIGIEKEHQKNVFDKFFRVPTGDVHDVKGFGIGLAYVKKIIELHHGSIQLQSEKGKGTTFTITLPNNK